MKKTERIAIFIDIANSEGISLDQILNQAGGLGQIKEIRAYGDFRQEHLTNLALELYAKGIQMVHCPSWLNGGGMKRSDDRLLEKEVRDMLSKQPLISTYVLATSDADIISTCHAIQQEGKRAILYSPLDEKLGWILKLCGFEIREVPRRTKTQKPARQFNHEENTTTNNHDTQNEPTGYEYTTEQLVREIDHLEKTSRYLAFMQVVGRIARGNEAFTKKVKQQLSKLVQEGIVENYTYQMPAIRLNRNHPAVISALGNGEKASEYHEVGLALAGVGVAVRDKEEINMKELEQ